MKVLLFMVLLFSIEAYASACKKKAQAVQLKEVAMKLADPNLYQYTVRIGGKK